MRRVKIIVVVALIAFALACEFIPIYVLIWDGVFNLTVHLDCSEGPPRSVACEVHGSRDEAEWMLVHQVPAKDWLRPVIADPFDGQAIDVKVPLSGRSSFFGRELARTQFQYLLVGITRQDGSRIGKVVEIPDCRVAREVTVNFP